MYRKSCITLKQTKVSAILLIAAPIVAVFAPALAAEEKANEHRQMFENS